MATDIELLRPIERILFAEVIYELELPSTLRWMIYKMKVGNRERATRWIHLKLAWATRKSDHYRRHGYSPWRRKDLLRWMRLLGRAGPPPLAPAPSSPPPA